VQVLIIGINFGCDNISNILFDKYIVYYEMSLQLLYISFLVTIIGLSELWTKQSAL
jgi:hypothetical protein